MKHRSSKCLPLLVAASAAATVCQAQLTNPGFENGSFSAATDWATIGDARITTTTYGITPTGTYQALVTNDENKHPGAVLAAALETFLNLTPGTLTAANNATVIEGSAIKQTFTASAGQVLTFSYDFAVQSDLPNSGYNDFAFAVIEPTGTPGSSILTLPGATVNSASLSPLLLGTQANSDFLRGHTGYNTFSYTIPSNGTYVLGLGVVDVGPQGPSAYLNPNSTAFLNDRTGNSGLLLDNFSLTPVPEPQAWSLIAGLGLCGVAVVRRFVKSRNFLRCSEREVM